MTTALIYSEILEACKQSGCPVCRLSRHAVRRSLHILFYEQVNDVELREHLRASLGFCNQHAWISHETGVGDVLGGAIIYHDVLTNVLRRLRNEDAPSQGGLSSLLKKGIRVGVGQIKSLAQGLKPQRRCLACIQQDEADELYLMELLKSLVKDELIEVLTKSDGLCLPHLTKALEIGGDGVSLKMLLAIQEQRIETLDAELAEVIRKFDYRFQEEPAGDEREAWRRAIRLAVGEPLSEHEI